MVEYRFDCAGYRVGIRMPSAAAGHYRIVIVGSSMAMGRTCIEEAFFDPAATGAVTRNGQKIEVYNYAMAFGFPRNVALRFDDVLAAKPDLICGSGRRST